MKSEVRLQKFIADCGVTSRRKAEDLILQGRVEVNGDVVRLLGTKVDPQQDSVVVDGHPLDMRQVEKIYVLMHKPRGCVTTVSDPEGRKTVMDFCQEVTERIYPVGRLDYLSEGLLLMTNDGEIANMVMHPSHRVTKVYEVKVFGHVNDTIIKNLRKGAIVDGEKLKPKSVRIVEVLGNKTWLEFRLEEGRNREIRRLCEACGLTIDKLKRVAIGHLSIEGIAPGKFISLKRKDVLIGISPDTEGNPAEYRSPKKTIKLKRDKKELVGKTLADDQGFVKFRKPFYYRTLEMAKVRKQEEAEKKKKEALAKIQESREKRDLRRAKKQKRFDNERKQVHAAFVDS